ncbi:phenylacetate--CoA ligase family protein [soil metagenome]
MRSHAPEMRGSDEARSERLRRLVSHAYERVPFYRERFDRAGVRPADIRTLADITRLPIVEKSDLLAAPRERITAEGYAAADLVSTMTSGYSGEPFVIRRTRTEQARWARSWLSDLLAAGLRRGDRLASVFFPRAGHPDGVGSLSALALVHETHVDCCLEPPDILAALGDARPTFLRGLSGVVDRIASSMTDRDRASIRPRVVWVSGEVLTAAARRRIEAGFRAPVHNAYGTHELGLLASECRETGLMHLGRPDLVVELVPPKDPRAAKDTREVVVTALDFHAAPFLRYRLSDVVSPGPDPCPCGSGHPTISRIEGRTIDYLELPDGRSIHPYRILGPTLPTTPWVRQFQLVQEAPDRIVLRLAPRIDLGDDERRRLSDAVVPVLGPGIRFLIEVVPRIAHGASGKARPIVPLSVRRSADSA